MNTSKAVVSTKLHSSLINSLMEEIKRKKGLAFNEEIAYDAIKAVIERHEKEGHTVCCLCGNVLPKGDFGNNAEPLFDGRCCNDCNSMFVIPQRILDLMCK